MGTRIDTENLWGRSAGSFSESDGAENSQESDAEIPNGRIPAKDIGRLVMQKGAIVVRPDESFYHSLSMDLPCGLWMEVKYTGLDPYFEPQSELAISIGGAVTIGGVVVKNAPRKISGTWIIQTAEINFDGEPKIRVSGSAPQNLMQKALNYSQWLADALGILKNVGHEAKYVVTPLGDLVAEPFKDRIMKVLGMA